MVKAGKITKVIKKLDTFGQPVQLYIKGKKLHTTTAGGIITLLMITALFCLFFYSLINLIQRKNVNIQEQTSYEMIPPLLDINKDNFMFSFGIDDPSLTQNNSLVGYNLTLVTMLSNDEEEESMIAEQSINIGPCDLNDYKKFADSTKFRAISRTFCPQNFSFPVQGDDDDDIYQYIKLNIVECVNGTHENITCAPAEQITQYFQDTPMVKFHLYFVNRAIDPYDVHDPYKEFIDLQAWAMSPLSSLSQISTISFRSMEVFSYDDIFGIQDPILHKAVGFGQDRFDLSFVPLKDTTTYFELSLKSSNYRRTCTRTYGNVLQVISFVGGIFNLMHLFLGIITAQISNHIYHVKMANKMYSFDLSNANGDENKSEETSEMKEEHPRPDENNPSYWKSIIQKKFEKARILRTSLTYPTFEYIKNLFCCLRTNLLKKKDTLFNMANKKILIDMDVGAIMRKLQDIEKLKQILLTPEQLGIFNFISSPSIGATNCNQFMRKNMVSLSNNEDLIIIGNGLNNLCDDLRQYYKYSRMYNELKKVSNPINDNILACLSPEIKEILDYIEKSNELGERKTEENQDLLPVHEVKLDYTQESFSNVDQNNSQALSPPLTVKQDYIRQANQTNYLLDPMCSKSTSHFLKLNKIDLDTSVEPRSNTLE